MYIETMGATYKSILGISKTFVGNTALDGDSHQQQVTNMATKPPSYNDEIDQTSVEYQPLLLRIVHSFREGVIALPSAEASFREGWRDVMQGNTQPIETL